MKKSVACFSTIGVLLSLGLCTGNVYGSDEEYSESSGLSETMIFDKDGNRVLPEKKTFVPISPEDDLRASTGPTKRMKLNNSESYQSNEFSGSGTRYGGYSFYTDNSSKNWKFTLSKGGFAINTILNWMNPNSILETINLPLSGSPYTGHVVPHFYFVVDNPNDGQTYNVKAVP